MQIGELSNRTGATVRMLRYYEEQGLLRPRRTGSGYRVFAESDIERVGYIRCMLASALPSGVVRQALAFLLDEPPAVPPTAEECRPLAEVLQAQLDALTERIELLNRSRDQLAAFVEDVRGQLTGDLVLRDVRPGDLPTFYEHQRDAEATTMADIASRERGPFMAHWTKLLADDDIGKRTVLFQGRIAGNLVLFGPPDRREVGYWLGRPFWGKGVATRALAAFLDEIPHRPLHAHVAAHNVASRRVLEKCGFRVVGENEDGIELLLT